MTLVRSFLMRHRAFAIALVAAALCLKALVPAGYMLGQSATVLTILVCEDGTGSHAAKDVVVPLKRDGSGPSSQHKGECPFSSLSMASMASPGPVLLALVLAFILALGFAPVRQPARKRADRIRPPLRGPPARA
ncbi:MAG: hypothetical protein ABT11_00085 [Novosphingobium sp. SCN 66-18]|nr:MAG: hypothetical protein ABT11_00085 [Novosphingobium sp. SCN 66-18]